VPSPLASARRGPDRRAALGATELIDSPPESVFDRLTKLAARELGVSRPVMSLVDELRATPCRPIDGRGRRRLTASREFLCADRVRAMLRLVPIALTVSALLIPAKASAIVGGAPAPDGRWPAIVAIVEGADALDGEECGGTVIAPNRVLTAAHCVTDTAPGDLRVIVGRTRLSQTDGRGIAVTNIALFPGYVDRRQYLDAAILTLAQPADVAPMRLATAADATAYPPGATAWVAGWGRLNANTTPDGGNYYADRLRELAQPVVGDDACENVYGGGTSVIPYRPEWTVCAGTLAGGSGSCYGDSGGPLAVQTATGWMQIGIVLGGDGCAEAGYYDLYTRVDRINAFANRPSAKLTFQPYPTKAPVARGHLKVGAHVSCVNGAWANHPSRFYWYWQRESTDAEPQLGRHHIVTQADVNDGLSCAVGAANAGGSYTAYSAPLR
jgi:secreted trypsin-like serine protease